MLNDKTIVFGGVSLRMTQTHPSTTTNNVVLGCVSLRASLTHPSMATTNDVLKGMSLPIAGFIHNGGTWEDPKDMSYVTIHD